MLDDFPWLIVGDFNLLRNPGNRNKPGGGVQEMLAFNEAISRLSLTEIPLKSCKFTFTWTNKWQNPLLERLDSNLWTTLCPNTTVSTLSTDTSDHTPCLITVSTSIPKPLSSDLKITGWSMTSFKILCNMVAIYPLLRPTKQRDWVANSKI
jgi:hypothetical protein